MILDGEDHHTVFPLHPERRFDQENDAYSTTLEAQRHHHQQQQQQQQQHRLCPMNIPINSRVSNCDNSSSTTLTQNSLLPISYEMMMMSPPRTEDQSGSSGPSRPYRAGTDGEQMENDDPVTATTGPCRRICRRFSSDHEVCELLEKQTVTGPLSLPGLCCDWSRPRCAERAGFRKWQKNRTVEGQPCKISMATTPGGGICRGHLRDRNAGEIGSMAIQRPSLDFDKMQRYCLTRVRATRGISKPKVVKVKSFRGTPSSSSSSSSSSLEYIIRREFLDPSVFSFRSISQNHGRASAAPSSSSSSIFNQK